MQTIWKYVLNDHSVQEIEVPSVHRILSIDKQLKRTLVHTEGQPEPKRTQVCMWVLVEDVHTRVKIQLYTVGTGYEVPSAARYISSLVVGHNDVRHFFAQVTSV